VVIGNLKETTFDMESMSCAMAQAQLAVTEHRHHRSVAGQDSNFAIECGGDDRIGLALEQHALG